LLRETFAAAAIDFRKPSISACRLVVESDNCLADDIFGVERKFCSDSLATFSGALQINSARSPFCRSPMPNDRRALCCGRVPVPNDQFVRERA